MAPLANVPRCTATGTGLAMVRDLYRCSVRLTLSCLVVLPKHHFHAFKACSGPRTRCYFFLLYGTDNFTSAKQVKPSKISQGSNILTAIRVRCRQVKFPEACIGAIFLLAALTLLSPDINMGCQLRAAAFILFSLAYSMPYAGSIVRSQDDF